MSDPWGFIIATQMTQEISKHLVARQDLQICAIQFEPNFSDYNYEHKSTLTDHLKIYAHFNLTHLTFIHR